MLLNTYYMVFKSHDKQDEYYKHAKLIKVKLLI